jgi:hypothetical protein
VSTTKHVTEARRAVRCWDAWFSLPVSATKTGTAENGSTIEKSDPNVTSVSVRSKGPKATRF